MSTDWIRSSYSGGAGGNCVEVLRSGPREVRVRDSKRIPGPELTVPTPSWAAFVAALGGTGA
ncbi:DUF397 domain-containing protein [Streptomyces triculaminicus]|uniref:DUF397 domain-containing protein n=1 Tax=Streptomyces triculaminicus TaxID=2816232 RepID=UPI0033C66E0E